MERGKKLKIKWKKGGKLIQHKRKETKGNEDKLILGKKRIMRNGVSIRGNLEGKK